MYNIFALLFLVCFIALFVYLIKYIIHFKKKDLRKKDRNKAIILFVASIACMSLFNTTMPESVRKENEHEALLAKQKKEREDKQAKLKEKENKKEEDKKKESKKSPEKKTIKKSAKNKITKKVEKKPAKKTVKKPKTVKKTSTPKPKKTETTPKQTSTTDFYNSGLTYNQITHEPNKYVGKGLTFTGEVLQVVREENKARSYILFYINGDRSQLALAKIKNYDLTKHNVMEHDNLNINGTYDGLMEYQSSLNGKKTVPAIYVMEYTSSAK